MSALDHLGDKYASCWDFALAYHGATDEVGIGPDLFDEVQEPEDGDLFQLFRNGVSYHCGIMFAGGYLHHASPALGVIYTKQGFTDDIRFYRAKTPPAMRHGTQ